MHGVHSKSGSILRVRIKLKTKKADPKDRLSLIIFCVFLLLNHESLRHAIDAIGHFQKINAVVQIQVEL